MLSLILYYFSADLKTTVAVEDWGAGLICDQEEIELSVHSAVLSSMLRLDKSSSFTLDDFADLCQDILNRLPHIEYRCLSSYSLVKTHVPE